MSYVLLKKENLTPPKVSVAVQPTRWEVANLLSGLDLSTPIAVDIETTGLNPKVDLIDAIGFYDGNGVAVSISTRNKEVLLQIVEWFNKANVKWYGFNTPFDGAFLVEAGCPMDGIVGDALVAFKLMSTEGYTGQRWNLDTAIMDVLGWPSSSKQVWDAKLKEAGLSKGEMWKGFDLYPEDYLTYNALDAAAAHQLMTLCRRQARDLGFPQIVDIHDGDFTTLVKLTIEQHLRGILVDREEGLRYEEDITNEIAAVEGRFLQHPTVRTFIEQWNNAATWAATSIITTEKKLWAKKSDRPWESPGWIRAADEDRPKPAAWEKEYGSWYRITTSTKIKHKKVTGLFNIGSAAHRRVLFYNSGLFNFSIGRPNNPLAKNEWERPGIILIPTIDGKGNKQIAERSTTDKGDYPTDADTLRFFGEVGELYAEWADLVKRKQFIATLLELSDNGKSVWYPNARVFGTVTGRSSAGE